MKQHPVFLEALDLGQVHRLVVRNLEALAGFDAQHAPQMLGRFARDLGPLIPHRLHKEPSSGHVQ